MMMYYFYTKMLLFQGERREYHCLTPLIYGLDGQPLATIEITAE